jgi:hypothetical protein
MPRYMYDAIWANVDSLQAEKPVLYALYLTGSSAIRWQGVPPFLATATPVRIDQGGQTSPQLEANVFDVEPGAWTMANALLAVNKCTAPRPTIYCDRADYATVPKSYTGDLWIAAPGMTDAEAIAFAATDKRIVAVQNLWANTFDRSIVVDPFWPNKAPAPKPTGLPTNVEAVAFATQSQINAKCDAVDGPETTYEWQLEVLSVKGWDLVNQQNTTGPVASFKGLEPKSHYRFRVTKGEWSDWISVIT